MANLTREAIAAWADLFEIPTVLRDRAVDALARRDAVGFLELASNTSSLDLVWRNWELLKSLGIFEKALLRAVTASRTNKVSFPSEALDLLCRFADPSRLRETGDPLPGPGPFTLYRGVAGRGRARRVRGLSWTRSVSVAAWFVHRVVPALQDPAVFCAIVPKRYVLAYTDGREEEEFLVRLPKSIVPERMHFDAVTLAALAAAEAEKRWAAGTGAPVSEGGR